MNRYDWLAGGVVALGVLASQIDARAQRSPAPAPHAMRLAPCANAPCAARLAPAPTRACAPIDLALPELISVPELDRPVPSIEDGDRLAPFYEKLAKTLRGEAKDHLRLAVYGDSNACKDFLTGEMRRWLQLRHGDAGHGWLALGKPWDWYLPMDIKHGLWRERWTSYVVSSRPAMDPYYGHGLIAAESNLRGAIAWFASAGGDAPIGKTFSDVEIYYLKRRGGGAFDLLVDGKVRDTVDTNARAREGEREGAREPEAAYHRITLEDAAHKIEITPRGGANVRLLGASVERAHDKPSFVVDNIAVGAASWRTMLREDESLDRATLAHRDYGIIVLHMGTNTWTGEPKREESMRALLARLRREAPDVPLLVMSSPDHRTNAELMAAILAPEQRRVAHEEGAAFFDFHRAMGGHGSMQAFYRNGMAMHDVIHWNEQGGAYMARRVLFALWKDFARWLEAHPRAGCPTSG